VLRKSKEVDHRNSSGLQFTTSHPQLRNHRGISEYFAHALICSYGPVQHVGSSQNRLGDAGTTVAPVAMSENNKISSKWKIDTERCKPGVDVIAMISLC
jgi:hypothetical protein